jgi:hypothetical protein
MYTPVRLRTRTAHATVHSVRNVSESLSPFMEAFFICRVTPVSPVFRPDRYKRSMLNNYLKNNESNPIDEW